ncbi:hypothetical protein D9M71_635200 [compost metagenome]
MSAIAIPKAKKASISLLVTSVDTYTTKSTGEVRVTVEAIEALPEGRKKGYGVMAYTAEPTIYDQIDLSEGLQVLEFIAEPREARNGFGNTTNRLHLLELVQPAAVRAAPSAPQAAKPVVEPAKS